MSSFFNKLFPYYFLWVQGWRDFFAGLPFLRRTRTFQLADGTTLTWSDGTWRAAVKGAQNGRLLAADRVLLRRFSLPVLPAKQIQTAVDSEVIVSSPFPTESTASGFLSTLTAQGQLMVEVAIFHRRELDATGSTDPVYAPGVSGPIPIRVKPTHASDRLTWALWLSVVVLSVSIVMMPLLELRERTIIHIKAFDGLQKNTAQLQNQRELLQQQFTQYQQLVALQDNHPDPLLVLDRLSSTLPDTSHLVFFSLKAQQISLEGQTPNALTLLNQLQNAQGFAAVQLSGAVQRHPQTGKDIFQMQMRFQP
jgi:Tfp pilus assembly protein PilN